MLCVKDSGFSPILIPLIFYSSQFILLIFHSCEHLQSARVCCDSCDCTFSQECDSVTSALFQRLRQSISLSVFYLNWLWAPAPFSVDGLLSGPSQLSLGKMLSGP